MTVELRITYSFPDTTAAIRFVEEQICDLDLETRPGRGVFHDPEGNVVEFHLGGAEDFAARAMEEAEE